MTSPRDESHTATNSNRYSSDDSPKPVLLVFGTRPEAIKLCPLISSLRARKYHSVLQPVVCVTGQHRQLLDGVLQAFAVEPDYDLDLMRPNQALSSLTSRMLEALPPVYEAVKPKLVVVQGDTTTAFGGALAAFYGHVPVAHVEAGLRTFDLKAPFPEEMNRVLASRLAELHFAPTGQAAENLRREGVAPESIHVTGNTGIDAVLSVRDDLQAGKLSGGSFPLEARKKLVVVTAHRRESFGEGLRAICRAIEKLAARKDVQVVWPVHPNPAVRGIVRDQLGCIPNVLLLPPLDYVPFVDLLQRAYMLITDSGGIQEEGPSLGKPILVLRDKTERPEAVAAGTVKLVGSDPDKIVGEARLLLEDQSEYDRMSRLHNPYGDGKASVRIAEHIAAFLRNI
jgi:UDP-N-acetylglucosamine 2-epimerase (non-hydrolysing)